MPTETFTRTTVLRNQVALDQQELSQLASQNERLRLVLDGTRLGIWDWNPQTNEVTFDERWAEMLGWQLDEIEQNLESWSSRVHPDDIAGCFADIQAHMEGKVAYYENVHRMRHKDGSWRYILDRGRIMERDHEGNPIRFTGTHTDITAQKVAELEARAAAENQQRFLASMSHEIRTPLNGIIGIIDILKTLKLDDQLQDWIRLMAESGEILQTVVDDILDLSKLDADEVVLDQQSFKLPSCLEHAVKLFEERAHRQQTELSVHLDDSVPPYMVGDKHRLQQIIMNLVSNAVKFSKQKSVAFNASANNGVLQLVIRDTGIGIDNTDIIWDRFSQADAGISQLYGGTGLGLPIVKHLVTLMNGSVEVESTPGAGSTFTVQIPITEALSAHTTGILSGSTNQK